MSEFFQNEITVLRVCVWGSGLGAQSRRCLWLSDDSDLLELELQLVLSPPRMGTGNQTQAL